MIVMVVGVVGLLFGSFANVLIARIPKAEPWVKDGSRCPRCGTAIAWYDNVPVISWLALRAKCRACREPISARYPIVELLTSAAFVAVYLTWGLTLTGAAFAYLALISVVLVAIDLDVHRLPTSIVLPALAVGAVLLVGGALVAGDPWSLVRALVGAATMGGFYFLLWLLYPAGLGFGDVRTAGLLGMHAGFLGWSVLGLAWFAGPMLGGLAVVVGLIARRLTRKSRIPYGPALIAGAWVGFLWGEEIVARYVQFVVG